MTGLVDLRPEHERIVRDILTKRLPPAVSVRVFGSRARGTAKPYSDLDLALMGGERLSLALLADLADAFSDSDLPFKVDVVDWRSAAPAFRAVIDRDGVWLTPAAGGARQTL